MSERDELRALTAGDRPPGVYLWRSRAHLAAIGRQLSAAGWGSYPIDGRVIGNGATFLDSCAKTLAFPAWFGRNWDALADCLTDLSWLPPVTGYVVVWGAHGVLAAADPPGWQLALDVFADAALQREQNGFPPLYLLLRGAGPRDGLTAL